MSYPIGRPWPTRLAAIYRRRDQVTTPLLPGFEVDVAWVFAV
ncbi:MAG TPA: hypothetical protein VGR07_06415 [Thermoanaerobaculia bacterium]|jgi:hypothetical protein|nr:hypothetical protein [Thermoanaerobaculia bacterium]